MTDPVLRATATEPINTGDAVEVFTDPVTLRREVRLARPSGAMPTSALAAFRTIPPITPASVPGSYAECEHSLSVTRRHGHWWHIGSGTVCADPAPAASPSALIRKTCGHALAAVWIQGAWRHVGAEWPGDCVSPPAQGAPVVRS